MASEARISCQRDPGSPFQPWPPTYQHRRLMMAVSESGIWMRSSSAEQFPPVDRSVTSVDVPLLDYLVILYAGLALSLVTLMLEILVHRYQGDRE
ncbi:hypothetical protein MTO96_005031 [Rhipicephalus appendiculatus]